MILGRICTSIRKKAAFGGLRDAREGKKKGAKMARTYTIGEAAKILAEGTDVEAITDIHKRFPMTAQKVLEAFAGGKDAVAEMMGYIPDFITTRKVEKQIVSGGSAEDDAEDVADDAAEPDAAEDKPAPKRRGRKPAAKAEDDEAEDEKPEPKKRGRKPAKAKPEPEQDAAEDEDAEDEDEGKYSGMNAMQLFKECKKRGIKAAPKKPAKFYVELLEADDAKADDVDDDSDDDDDWDI